MGEAIVVTSGKGGVGKTTTSANVGTGLAMLGHKVCLVDLDIGLRNLDVVMGLDNRIIYDIVDVVEERCRLSQALVKDKRFDELYFLPAAQTRDKDAITSDHVKNIIEELKQDHDYIIIDCPAGIEQGFKNAVAGADQAIIVTTPENAAVRDADRIIGLLYSAGIHSTKLIINRVRPHMMKSGEMLDIDQICTTLAIDLLGVVPDDEYVIKAGNAGEPTVLSSKARASMAYRNIARRILGDSVPLLPLEEKRGLLRRLRNWIGGK